MYIIQCRPLMWGVTTLRKGINPGRKMEKFDFDPKS